MPTTVTRDQIRAMHMPAMLMPAEDLEALITDAVGDADPVDLAQLAEKWSEARTQWGYYLSFIASRLAEVKAGVPQIWPQRRLAALAAKLKEGGDPE